jgi:sugar/nucleoside kinase (ribokinase family)
MSGLIVPTQNYSLPVTTKIKITYNLSMETHTPTFVFAGRLYRDYYITADDEPVLDVLGGNVPYAAVGAKIWEQEPPPGIMARVGEDFPQAWLQELEQKGIDTSGVRVLPKAVDVRNFYVYKDKVTRVSGDPIPHFARLGIDYPKALLGYKDRRDELDSRVDTAPTSLRQNDIPESYQDAVAAHLCPLDYISHSLMPAAFRQSGFTTVTLDPVSSYMNPTFWSDIPSLVTGLTAFIPAEEDLRALFEGKSEDIWEMAEALTGYGCEHVVIKRGERGQWLYDAASKSRWEIPAYPARVANPTGVGDAFCGGFLAGYRQSYDPLEATLYGNIAASIISEGSGIFFALDVLAGLPQARLDSLRQSVREL